MKQIDLRKALMESLGALYDTAAVTRLSEFWQGEQRVLLYICRHAGCAMNPSALSAALHVSRARMTTALTALRRKGFIIMEMCEEDRRRMRVILTDRGRTYIGEKIRCVEAGLDEWIEQLEPNKTASLIRLIEESIAVIGGGPDQDTRPARLKEG